MMKRSILSVLAACGVALSFASVALAYGPAPGYEVFGRFGPTNLTLGGQGLLHLYVYNLGDEEGNIGPTVTSVLPAGMVARASEAEGAECTGTSVVTCHVSPIGSVVLVVIPVSVSSSPGSEAVRVAVSGGGALGVANATVPVHYGSEPAPFGLVNADAWFTNPDGTIDTQAGSHPTITVVWAPTSYGMGNGQEVPSNGEARFLNVSVPPGFVGEPGAVPKCTRTEFDNSGQCRLDSQIGEDAASDTGAGVTAILPVFNMVPPPGVAAEFAFTTEGGVHVFIDARIRSGGDYGITEHANVPQLHIVFNSTTIWGVPGEHEANVGLKPLLSMPTACGGPGREPGEIKVSVEQDGAWENESINGEPFNVPMHNNEDAPVGITGCEKLKHFQPSINLAPDTSFSDTPAGLSTIVKVPARIEPRRVGHAGLEGNDGRVARRSSDQPGSGDRSGGMPTMAGEYRWTGSGKGNDGRTTVLPGSLEGRHRRNRDTTIAEKVERQRICPSADPPEPAAVGRRLRRRREPEADRNRSFERSRLVR